MSEAPDDMPPDFETRCDIARVRPLLRAQTVMLRDALAPEQHGELKAIPEEELILRTHFDLGLLVRNRWLYRKDCELMAALDTDDVYFDTDGISALIVRLLWRQLHGQELTDGLVEQLLREHVRFFS